MRSAEKPYIISKSVRLLRFFDSMKLSEPIRKPYAPPGILLAGSVLIKSSCAWDCFEKSNPMKAIIIINFPIITYEVTVTWNKCFAEFALVGQHVCTLLFL